MKKNKKIFTTTLLVVNLCTSLGLPLKAVAIVSDTSVAPDLSIEETYFSDPILSSSSLLKSTDEVTIPDEALKTVILTKLGKAPDSQITQGDMALLISLDLTSLTSNLSGLEYAINLQDINMSTNLVTDFSPLEKLSNLKYVRLQGTNVTSDNFPDLSNNASILLISLSYSGVDDRVMSKLTPLTTLESLSFDSNMNITTIAPLKVLPNLKLLFAQFCGITDFTVINEFPALTQLAAYGQNTGRNNPATTINSTKLSYDTEAQTLFIPFSLMPNRLTNFDGYIPPFTTSNVAGQTYLDFNGIQLPPERLQITEEGLTVHTVSQEEYAGLSSFQYNAFLNSPAGSYAQPAGYTFYAISSGTYLHQFNVVHGPEAGAPVTIRYTDTIGNELASPTTLTGNIGHSYETIAKELANWSIVINPDNSRGVFKDYPQEVTYVYEKAVAAPVTIHYVDMIGNELAPKDIIYGKLDDPYEITAKQIKNWITKKKPENETGTFTNQAQTITYMYEKIEGAPVTVNYLDIAGNPLKIAETIHGKIDEVYETAMRQIDGWELKNKPLNGKGTFTNEAQTVNYTYDKKEQPFVPQPNDTKTSIVTIPVEQLILSNNTVSQNELNDSSKHIDELLLPQILQKNNLHDKVQSIGKNNKNKTGTLTIKYVDENGNELAPPKKITGKIGDSYTAVAKNENSLLSRSQ